MFSEVEKLKTRYAHQIEDGRKISVFTSMPEYQWYVEHVVKPTIEEYTDRIMKGSINSDKEDWILRGMVQGMQLMIDTPEQFIKTASEAKEKARLQEEAIEDDL